MISLFFFACHATAEWSELKLLSDPEVLPKSDLRQFAKEVIYSCNDWRSALKLYIKSMNSKESYDICYNHSLFRY